MIYSETYNFLMKNVSSTEFDLCLYSLLNSDWDGVIQSPANIIAANIGTTTKYTKQMLQRLSSNKRSNAFIPTEDNEGIKYIFKLGIHSKLGFNKKTDRYCRKFSFFYEDAFRQLPIDSKRILLMAAKEMSISKNEKVNLRYDELVPNRHHQGFHNFSKARLIRAIKAIQNSNISEIVDVALASSIFRHKVIIFNFTPGTLEDFKSNFTERTLLRKKLFLSGYSEYVSDEFCKEITSTAKYLFNSISRLGKIYSKKVGPISGVQDELFKIARSIYNKSIEHLSNSLKSKDELIASPKKASAYLSSIMHNLILDEMSSHLKQKESINSLITDFEHIHRETTAKIHNRKVGYYDVQDSISDIKQRYEKANFIYSVLNNWSNDWFKSRVERSAEAFNTLTNGNQAKVKEVTDNYGWTSPDSAIEFINSLKDKIADHISGIQLSINKEQNRSIKDKVTKSLSVYKNDLDKIISLCLDRFNINLISA